MPICRAYIQIFMVGRKPGGAQRLLSGGRARGHWEWRPRPPSARKALIPSGAGCSLSVLGNSQLRAGPRLRPWSSTRGILGSVVLGELGGPAGISGGIFVKSSKQERAREVTLTLIPRWKFDIPGKRPTLDICSLKRHHPVLASSLRSHPGVISLSKAPGALILVGRPGTPQRGEDLARRTPTHLLTAVPRQQGRQGCYLRGSGKGCSAPTRSHTLFMLTACTDDICKLTANILSTCWSVS